MSDKVKIDLNLAKMLVTELFVVLQKEVKLVVSLTPGVDLNVRRKEEVTLER